MREYCDSEDNWLGDTLDTQNISSDDGQSDTDYDGGESGCDDYDVTDSGPDYSSSESGDDVTDSGPDYSSSESGDDLTDSGTDYSSDDSSADNIFDSDFSDDNEWDWDTTGGDDSDDGSGEESGEYFTESENSWDQGDDIYDSGDDDYDGGWGDGGGWGTDGGDMNDASSDFGGGDDIE